MYLFFENLLLYIILDPKLSSASAAPTSQVHMSAMSLLLG